MAPPDSRWERFASREPFFAVLTQPRYRRANLTPEAERAFFAGGEELVDWILHIVAERYRTVPESIAEYGCGAGRLAVAFARRAGSVAAIDRSPAMLGAARAAAAQRGLGDVVFQSDDEFFASGRSYDLLNCYLVLQRLPPAEGLALMRRLLDSIGSAGIGVFHVPFRSDASRAVAAARRARERMPIVNGVANVVRRKSFDEPFIATHTYDLDDVFTVLDDAGFEAHVDVERDGGLASAFLFVRRRLTREPFAARRVPEPETATAGGSQPATDEIDVRELIARTSIDDLNRTAEEYFAGLTDWEHHLAKPFGKPDETPPLLMNLAVLLQGLRLTRGMTVLEFGAGTGWLSRYLTQLGCEAILLDVSATALRIARELYERQPPIGDQPPPRFIEYDGRRIDLPDASVDRILCFDAFHHSPNPDDVLREFARILRPGGIAGFAEPGPRHSRTPLSQFEMRTYGVVENDVDVHAIWRTARACGFRELRLAVFHIPMFHLPLDDYEDLLAGGATGALWLSATRSFLRNTRDFFLTREGSERLDSRSVAGLRSEVHAAFPRRAVAGEPIAVRATVANRGTAVWLPSNEPSGGVALGAHLYDGHGKLVTFDVHWQRLTDPPREIAPGETVEISFELPPLAAGSYIVDFDCVAARVTWFAQAGSATARLPLEVAARDV